MLALLGQTTLILALIFAFAQSFIPLYGLYQRNSYALAFARPSLWGQFICITSAYCILTMAFITNDLSLTYVAANSHPSLPFYYRLTAVWGAHEGSIWLPAIA